MFGTKLRSGMNTTGDETIRRVTREKIVIRGNRTIRTLDSTTSFLPVIERYVMDFRLEYIASDNLGSSNSFFSDHFF